MDTAVPTQILHCRLLRPLCFSIRNYYHISKYMQLHKGVCYNVCSDCRKCILNHDQQDATLYNTLYYCQRSTCFEGLFRSSSGAQICTCSITYLSNLFAVTASVDELGQVWQIPDAACTDLSSWWWAENPLETCRALTIIQSVIQRCILLVMLKNTLTVHDPMNAKPRKCLFYI